MTQAQLLALDAILPTLLGFGGLVFVALGLWPGRPSKADRASGWMMAAVGIACLGASVWLWLTLFGTQARFALPAAPQPLATPAASRSSQPRSTSRAAPFGRATTQASASQATAAPAGTSTPTSPRAGAAPSANVATTPTSQASADHAALAPRPASEALPISPSGAMGTSTPLPTPSPIAAIPFQPDTASPHAVIVSIEPFQHGTMLYRSDTKQIYVLAATKRFKVYPDTWTATQPDFGSLTPVAGKYFPRRGFGKLWSADQDVRQKLGLALAPEQGQTAQISGNGSSTTVAASTTYVFEQSGTWSSH